MMLQLPSRAISWRALSDAPSPTASIAITELTPKTMPSMVRIERTLCRKRFLTPSERMRRIWSNTAGQEWGLRTIRSMRPSFM
jgi:hypothetical protein